MTEETAQQTIFARLLQKNAHIDRTLDHALAQRGLTGAALLGIDTRLAKHDPRRVARIASRIEGHLATRIVTSEAARSWELAGRPTLQEINRRCAGRALRV